MDTAMRVVSIILMICSIALIAIVTVQSNRGGDMSAITGSNRNSSGKGQAAGKEMKLKRATIISGIVFVVVVVVMNVVELSGIA